MKYLSRIDIRQYTAYTRISSRTRQEITDEKETLINRGIL